MLAEETGETDLHLPLDSGRASHNSQNSGESFASSAARSSSINIDARSDISEATTVSIREHGYFTSIILNQFLHHFAAFLLKISSALYFLTEIIQ